VAAKTIKDVAARAGVSAITVSRVVNHSGYVNADTRARVETAIRELQYIPNGVASMLRSRQSDTLALLLPTITNSFWTTIARGVEDEAGAQGYSVFLCNTDDDPVKEARYFAALTRHRVAGIVIVPTAGSGPQLRQVPIPFVQVHRVVDGLEADTVRADGYGGTLAVVQHLLGKGFRRIGFIGRKLVFAQDRERLAAYHDALAAVGVPADPHLVALGTHGVARGRDLMNELLAANPRPDAVVIGNSRLALGALAAAAHAGVRVPDDLAVAAFYDINALDEVAPHLTTVAQPAYEIGRQGVRRLLERVRGERADRSEDVLENRLHLR